MQQRTFTARMMRTFSILILILCLVTGGYATYRYLTFEQMVVGFPNQRHLCSLTLNLQTQRILIHTE